MTTLTSLTNKLFVSPTPLQFLVVADCLQELGFTERAWAMRVGFHPDAGTVWLGSSGYGCGDGGGGYGSGSYGGSTGCGTGGGSYGNSNYGNESSLQAISLTNKLFVSSQGGTIHA